MHKSITTLYQMMLNLQTWSEGAVITSSCARSAMAKTAVETVSSGTEWFQSQLI